MKRFSLLAVLLALGVVVGIMVERGWIASQSGGAQHHDELAEASARKILYWRAPMDPNFRSAKPGKSPMGMDLIPVYADDDSRGEGGERPSVFISPAVINNLGVRTTMANRQTLARIIDTVGYVEYDETLISHIHSRTDGWIENLQVHSKGDFVQRGQLLFQIYSPTLVNAQEEFIESLAAKRASLTEASRERLQALGISKRQLQRLEKERRVDQYVRIYAPQSGVLSSLNARDGMYVSPATEIMALANLDSVWLVAEVFERQATWVATGQQAQASFPAMPGRMWEGAVQYVYPDLNPVTRTLRARLQFDNAEGLLKPNMFANVLIATEPRSDVLVIPRQALIRDGRTTRVILSVGDGRFEPREVAVGVESGDVIEIRSGLNDEDIVVTSGQFLIDSEASLNASLERMQADGGAVADPSPVRE